ncbi:hypothetical protein JCM8547_008665 [Rhodosporidiobolus lusitaniae]
MQPCCAHTLAKLIAQVLRCPVENDGSCLRPSIFGNLRLGHVRILAWFAGRGLYRAPYLVYPFPPLSASMEPPSKRKKPPACDQCKLKRVLCHPNPAGCPRCMEKGLTCTTTPVIPKKRAPRGAMPPPVSSAPCPAQIPAGAIPAVLQPAAPTPQIPLKVAPPPDLVAPPAGMALALVPSVLFPLVITPELAQHLFHCFLQTSMTDHPVFVQIPPLSLFTSVSWHINLLRPSHRTLACAILTLGCFLSFSPSILGTSAPTPESFSALNDSVLEAKRAGGAADMREFGRRRKEMCRRMVAATERMAKEADIGFDATFENAATAMLLDSMAFSGISTPASAGRPWLSIYMAHLRSLADSEHSAKEFEIHLPRWTIHLATEVVSEIDSGRLTSMHGDRLFLAGGDRPDILKLDARLKLAVQRPRAEDVWPDVQALSRVYLDTARELVDKLTGTYARRAPFEELALSEFLSTLDRLRSISASHCACVDSLFPVDFTTNFECLLAFPHAVDRPKRYTLALGQRNMRSMGAFAWSSLVLPLYRELQRRLGALSASAAMSDSPSFAERMLADRVSLALNHVRELLRAALEAKVENLAGNPFVGTFIALSRIGMADWARLLLEEVEAGTWLLDGKTAALAERFSSVLKLAGYIHSTPEIDDLILQLDNLHLAFRLAQQPITLPGPLAPALSNPLDFLCTPSSAPSSTTAFEPVLPTSLPHFGLLGSDVALSLPPSGPSASSTSSPNVPLVDSSTATVPTDLDSFEQVLNSTSGDGSTSIVVDGGLVGDDGTWGTMNDGGERGGAGEAAAEQLTGLEVLEQLSADGGVSSALGLAGWGEW